MLKTYTKKIEKWIHSLNTVAHRISIIVVFLMMVLTFADVMGRYFWVPIIGTFELTEIGLAVIVFFGLGYTQLKKGHIAIGILVDRWPPRIQAIVEAITYLITIMLILLTVWQLLQYAELLKAGNNVTGELHIPVYIFVLVSATGLFIYMLALIADFCKSIFAVVSKNES